jgi:hypothetical protein
MLLGRAVLTHRVQHRLRQGEKQGIATEIRRHDWLSCAVAIAIVDAETGLQHFDAVRFECASRQAPAFFSV